METSKRNKKVKLGNESISYSHFDKYVIRTPILPFKEIEDLDIPKIRALCSKPEIAEAIFLASPELHQEMLKYLNRNHEDKDDKLVFALMKYLIRMGSRCTPFGLFSGCAVGKIENETSIVLKNSKDFERSTRLDMQYLCALSQKIESIKEIRSELKYYPNTSLYKIGDEIRYVEYQFIGVMKKHFLMSIDYNDFINGILNISKDGVTIEALALSIVDSEISFDDATNFIHELIDNQILISTIFPTVTGKDYFDLLIDEIKSEPVRDWLININEKLKRIDKSDYNENLVLYQEIADLASLNDIQVDKKHLFQTDLKVTCLENKIDENILENIKEALNIICKIAPEKQREKKLEHFKTKFYEKFEDEEVPLTLALDVESGIGFGEEFEDAETYFFSEFVDDIPHSSLKNNTDQVQKIEMSTFCRIMLNKLLVCLKNNDTVVEIKDEDLKEFKDNWHLAPTSFSTNARIILTNNNEPLIYLPSFGGITASFMLNRFSSVDNDIYSFVEEIYRTEKSDDVLFAEIVHLPESRTGNILFRKNLREYEIPYLAKSALPTEQQIMISDLYVSIRNERIFLRSKKHNKEVIPVLSNAHNVDADPLPIYAFLTGMMIQGKREYFGFKWGDAIAEEKYLPRVVYKNIIISPAAWIIYKSELKTLNSINDLQLFIQKRNIPNRVQIIEFDNHLLINFENELSCRMFLSMAKKQDSMMIEEYLFDKNKSIVKQNGQGMANEIIFSFYKESL